MKTIKQRLCNFCLNSLALGLGASTINAASDSPAELLIKCDGGPSGALARAADAAIGATTVRRFEAIGWHLVRLPEGVSVAQGMARYRAQPGVLKVEPNRQFFPLPAPLPPSATETADENERRLGQHASNPDAVIPNDPRYRSQWNLKKIGMEQAWAITTGSTNVVVAVIDTGVDYNHPDLAANMWRNPGETGLDSQGHDKATNGIDDDGNGYVDDVHGVDVIAHTGDPMDRGQKFPTQPNPNYHGTKCAGVIAASANNGIGMAGIAWNVQIIAIAAIYGEISTEWQRGILAHVLAGYDYLLKMKRRGVNIRVANNSYLSEIISDAAIDAFQALSQEGILMVFGAGNDGRNSDLTSWRFSMIDAPNVISVTGTDGSDQQIFDYGRTTTDLAAPAQEIITLSTGTNYVTDFDGTSAACPHVAGAAALLCAVKPDITANELKAALFGSVDILSSLKGKTRTNGRLNVARALRSLTNSSPPPIVIYAAPGAVRTDPSAPIELVFNQPMDRTSVEAAFRIEPPPPATFPGMIFGVLEWAKDNRSFVFRHAVPFEKIRYTVTLAGTARSVRGDTLDGNYDRMIQGSPQDDYVWNFDFALPNDDLAGAQPIEGGEGSIAGNNVRATTETEAGEMERRDEASPMLFKSVWYRWSAPSNGWFTFDLRGASFNTSLGVFRGTNYEQLVELASNDNYANRKQSRISFAAEGGLTYSLVVGGDILDPDVGGDGNFTLRWYPTPPPAISSFAPPRGFPGQVVTLVGTNFTGATSVKLNGTPIAFAHSTNASLHDVRLVLTLPTNATTGLFTVETPYGNAAAATELTVIPLPTLTMEISPDGGLVLSWRDDASGFALQASDRLGPDANWKGLSLPAAPTAMPGFIRLADTPGLSNRFYRLWHP